VRASDGSLQSVVLIATPLAEERKRLKNILIDKYFVCLAVGRNDLRFALEQHRPSVLLVSRALLKKIREISAIRRISSATKIILLTIKPDDEEAVIALQAGADGYCSSNQDPNLLLKAVEMVQKGEIWTPRGIIGRLLKSMATANHPSTLNPISNDQLDSLTSRENEIAHLIGDGLSNKEIAIHLKVSETTVKSHLTTIFRKLGVSDRLGLALVVTHQNRPDRRKLS
jgi:DNA-binding NarL/FixJ family response regulator